MVQTIVNGVEYLEIPPPSGLWRATKYNIVSVHPLWARASRPLKWRPRWPRSQEKVGGVNAYGWPTFLNGYALSMMQALYTAFSSLKY